MNKILVIGYGNILRSDDGAGYKIAELISQKFPHITTIASHDLKPEYAELLAQHQVVFFIDASIECEELEIEEIKSISSSEIENSHHLKPSQLVYLSKKLFNNIPQKILLAKIPAYNLEFGNEFSTLTQNSINSFIQWFENFQKTIST